jgi:flagellar operon protein
MTISNDYLKARSVSVTTGQVSGFPNAQTTRIDEDYTLPSDSPFAKELQALLGEQAAKSAAGMNGLSSGQTAVTTGVSGDTTIASTVLFSKHALSRIEERGIDMDAETISRLTRSLNLAKAKNCTESLMLIDGNAFLVSVSANKVITAMSGDDIRDSIFTNIDSTIIG